MAGETIAFLKNAIERLPMNNPVSYNIAGFGALVAMVSNEKIKSGLIGETATVGDTELLVADFRRVVKLTPVDFEFDAKILGESFAFFANNTLVCSGSRKVPEDLAFYVDFFLE